MGKNEEEEENGRKSALKKMNRYDTLCSDWNPINLKLIHTHV